MNFLMIGAGALGGYFGARLLAAQRDVTFLLRPRRVAQLLETGLVIKSRFGDLHLPTPSYLLADDITTTFDVIIVACKSYDLEETMDSFAMAVGPNTVILPLLNGIGHLDRLAARFGKEKILGGLSMISATLDENGIVHHLNDTHWLAFGERAGGTSARVQAIAAQFASAHFDSHASDDIMLEIWEKWIAVAAGASITSLMRANVGNILAAGGESLIRDIVDECAAVAAYNHYPPRPAALERMLAFLTAPGSQLSASMAKDIERGGAVEADQIVGDMLRHAPATMPVTKLLKIAYIHLKTYEIRRETLATAQEPAI